MLQKRQCIFETNSSSTHTLTFATTKLDFTQLSNLVNKNTLEITACNQNDFRNGVVSTTSQKLQYMLTWICIKYFEDVMYHVHNGITFSGKGNNPINKYFEINAFCTAARNIANIDITTVTINFNGTVQWDHQTTPDESRFVIDFNDEKAIMGYLCDPNISVKIGRDDGIDLWNS